MIRSRKSQVQHIFTYIIAVIVVGVVVYFGYQAIAGFMKQGCDVEKITFEKNLESFISKHKPFGKNRKEVLQAPCGYTQVCFVDKRQIGNDSQGHSSSPFNAVFDGHSYPLITSSIQDGVEATVFLYDGRFSEPILNANIFVNQNNGFICVENKNGKFSMMFSGKGLATEVSPGN